MGFRKSPWNRSPATESAAPTKADANTSTLTGSITNDATVTVGNETTPDTPGDHEGKGDASRLDHRVERIEDS